MIECRHLDTRIVRGRQEPVAGTEAGSDDAQLLVALLLEPVEAAAKIDHALARGVEGASNVSRNGVIGAAKLGRTTNVVVRHAQPQHGNSQTIQNSAE